MKGGYKRLIQSLARPVSRNGFTIVEVMIVLAVSGALFASVVLMVNGKRATAEFYQAANSVKLEIEQIVNEVESGYSLGSGSYTCTVVGNVPTITATPAAQGSNSGCIFLGKTVHFSQALNDRYGVYVVVGNRLATDFASSSPRTSAILMETRQLHAGATLVYVRSGVGPTVGGFSLATGFTQTNTSSSGSQKVDVRPIGSANQTSAQMIAAINTNLSGVPPNPAGGVTVCLRSGATDQSALLTVGGSNARASVTLEIKGTVDCT